MRNAARAGRALGALAVVVGAIGVATASAAAGRPVQDVVAGHGLSGGGKPDAGTGSVSIAVDPAVVQNRVSGTCAAGQSIAAIAQDGSVSCEADADTTYSAGSGLVLSGFVFSVDTATIQARIAGSCGAGEAIRLVDVDGSVVCASLADDFVRNGTSPQNASFNVTGTAAIGSAANPFVTKLRVAGGNWNPNDSDTDVLIGDSVHRLKIGVATGGSGAGDVRVRAMGGTNRLSLGSGTDDVVNIRGGKVGVNVFEPATELDVAGDVAVTGQVRKSYSSGTSNPALPIAFGIVSGGLLVNATPNVSATWNATIHAAEITIAGETYDASNYVTVVTPMATRIDAATNASGGKLLVRLTNPQGDPYPGAFQFVTYELG